MTGEKIKQLRKSKMLTQKRLGELCKIDEANIRKYENGKLNPSLPTIRKIAAALEVSISELVDDWGRYPSEEITANVSSKDLHNSSQILINKLESLSGTKGNLNQVLLENNLHTLIDMVKESSDLNTAFKDAHLAECSVKMAELLKMLNEAGRAEAIKRVTELTQLNIYKSLI